MSPQGIGGCVLCGSETSDRVMALVEWFDPPNEKRPYDSVPRCRDRVDCRRRVELEVGEPWPVNDGTPAPERPAPPPAGEALPVAEPSPPDAQEEALPWLR